jgi:hypothetical protein
MHAFYSAQAARMIGDTCIYLNKSGEEVECTCVTEDITGSSYLWEDKIYVGEVVECIKSIKPKYIFYTY